MGIIEFIMNGIRTFGLALRCQYDSSNAINSLKDEVYGDKSSNAERLKSDKQAICRDIRKSFDKLKLANG